MSYPGNFSFHGIHFIGVNSTRTKYGDKKRSNFQYGTDSYLDQF